LWDGLRELGYIEGQNVAIEFRSAEGKYERLPALASELVGLKPRLILASTSASTQALKDLTTSIPVVMVAVSDPVSSGFVESLARPGANLTGISINQVGLIQKQMQLLKEVQPTISRIAVTWNPSNPAHAAFLIEAEAASTKLNVDVFGVQLVDGRIPEMLQGIISGKADGVLVVGDTIVIRYRGLLIDFVNARRLPAIYTFQEDASEGGLIY